MSKIPYKAEKFNDVKGLYAKAKAGQIKHFTGISDPYEEPLNPEIICQTDKFTIEQCVNQVLDYLEHQELICADVGGGGLYAKDRSSGNWEEDAVVSA